MRSFSSTALVLAALGAACRSDGPTVPVDHAPSFIVAASSTSLNGTAGAALDAPVAVRVTMRSGEGARGVTVTFHVVSGDGTVNPATVTTNDQGVAATTWTLGRASGGQSISAEGAGLGPVTFTAVAAAGPPTSLAKVAGDNQVGTVGFAVATVPSVRVVDAAGNPVVGATVTFAVASGGGTVTDGAATSGADGLAAPSKWTLGTKVGANTLTATSGNLTATFSVAAVVGSPQTITFASPLPREIKMGDRIPFSARAFDTYGNENTTAAILYGVSPSDAGLIDDSGMLVALRAGPLAVVARSGLATASSPTTSIGHPAAMAVTAHFFANAPPEGVTATETGIWSISTDGNIGTISHFDFDGTLLNTPITVESPALGYVIMAPGTSGNTAIVANVGALSSQYWFIDIAKNAIVDSITTQRYLQFASMSSDGRRAYVVLDAGELAVIDVAAHKFLPSIPLGSGIESFRVAHGDSLAYAHATIGTMFEIDLIHGVVRRQFSMPGFTDIDVSRDGTLFYVLDNPAFLVRVFRISDLFQVRQFTNGGSKIAASPDGAGLFLVTAGGSGPFVQSYLGDPTNGFVVGPPLQPNDTPKRLFFDASGSRMYIVNSSGTIDIVR